MSKIYKIDVIIHEGDYNKGEGEQVNEFDFECKTLKECINECQISNKKEFEYDEENNNFFVDVLVNNDNIKASDSEIEKWKNGELKLYNARYFVNVFDVIESKEL